MLKPKTNGCADQSVPAQNGMRVRMTITPELAAEWLEKNTLNRTLRQTRVTVYARAMSRGLWKYNYQPIILDGAGRLIDGQHRLWACVESGVSFDSDVIFNASREIMDTLDGAASRSNADHAQLQGVSNANMAASIAKLLIIYEDGNIHRCDAGGAFPTTQEVVERSHEAAIQEAIVGARATFRLCKKKSVAGLCYYLFHRQNAVLCERFFQELATGEMLEKRNPAFQLRKRLVAQNAQRAILPYPVIIALFFKAWIAYRANKGIGVLTWRSTGSNPEPFPEI